MILNMITQSYIKKFLQQFKVTVNYLAEQSKIRPATIYKFLKNPNVTITIRTAKKIEKGMDKIAKQKKF